MDFFLNGSEYVKYEKHRIMVGWCATSEGSPHVGSVSNASDVGGPFRRGGKVIHYKSFIFVPQPIRRTMPANTKPLTEIRRDIEDLLVEALPEALKALRELLPEGTEKHQQVLLLVSRLNAANKDMRAGVIDFNEYELRIAAVRRDTLILVGELQESDFEVPTEGQKPPSNAKEGIILYQVPGKMPLQKPIPIEKLNNPRAKPLRATALFLAFLMASTSFTYALTPDPIRDWWVANNVDTSEAYAQYIQDHGAEKASTPRVEKAYFYKAKASEKLEDLRDYQKEFRSNGEFEHGVVKKIRTLEIKAVESIEKAPELNKILRFLADFPDATQLPRVKAAVEQLPETQKTAALSFLKSLPIAQEPSIPGDLPLAAQKSLQMAKIPAGQFTMGDLFDEGSNAEKPTHQFTISAFEIGKYEVTQDLWYAIMQTRPSEHKNCSDCPVEKVSWEDIHIFLQKLNALYPGKSYRLPTEAEWEYAAREGGKQVRFGNGKDVADPAQINFDGRESHKESYSLAGLYREKTVAVGSLRSPNALGLHDMSGNVREWCSDWYGADYYKKSPAKDPLGPGSGSDRVCRGGSWVTYPQGCRVADRGNSAPGNRFNYLGLRLARTL